MMARVYCALLALVCVAALCSAVPLEKRARVSAGNSHTRTHPQTLAQAQGCPSSASKTTHGVVVKVTGDHYVEIAVGGLSSFRVSVSYTGEPPVPKSTPMVNSLDASQYPTFTVVCTGTVVGIKTSFGAASIDSATNAFVLMDAQGKNITSSPNFSEYTASSSAHFSVPAAADKCSNVMQNTDISDGQQIAALQDQTQASCCAACNANPNCDVWILASPGHESQGNNCWLMHGVQHVHSASYRTVGGNINPPPSPPSPPSPSPSPSPPSPPPPPSKNKCNNVIPNTDVSDGQQIQELSNQTQASCCAACNSNPNCDMWILASPGSESQGFNCWLMNGVHNVHPSSDRTVGGNVTPPPPPPASITINLSQKPNTLFYGAGAGSSTAQQLSQTSSNPHVTNTEFFTSHYYSTEGYAVLGVSELDFAFNSITNYPATWNAQSGNNVEWFISGEQIDMYFMPAATLAEGTSAYWDLIGRPAVPPRYAFGFLACRWGWQDANYIWSMLTQFRSGNFPIDAWISDFEWYTPQPDYSLPDSGSPTFVDFGYNNITFPNPIPQLTSYHEQLNMRFGGIRKPRLGNSDLLVMAHNNGWIVNGRNLNYSLPAVRDWYSKQLTHFLPDGVDFWWNDEGEIYYFNFHWWNIAQLATLQNYNQTKRFFTINRSYSPGMSRLGAVVWTGDIGVSFQSMQQVPGYFLNWALAGVGFTTCDIGGFNGPDDTPLLLTRWYQLGALMPIMRVHSTNSDTPHFPFLYGDDAAAAMRKALNLRYQLVPYHYSNAHAMNQPGGVPIVRPLLMQYPNDTNVAQLTSQWLDGPSLLATPILNEDNSTAVYLPAGTWYTFNSTETTSGPTSFTIQNAALDMIPIYVSAGAIIPLAPVVQYTDQLPGGPLTVHIYPGADATFTMVEDDGATNAYLTGTIRKTTFTWKDASRTLSWQVNGTFSDAHTFTQLQAVAFFTSGAKQTRAQAISTSGSISF